MFTGLVEDVGALVSRQVLGKAGKLTVVATQLPLAEVRIGDSIAVNGTCLTVEAVVPGARHLVFHTLAETLKCTNLGTLRVGGAVNLERALRLGDRLGGHLVSGHIDGVARVLAISETEDDWVYRVALPPALAPFVVSKGSIAVDGISLTVAALGADWFEVHLIPHTRQATNLGRGVVGAHVNLETDIVGKYILRQRELASDPAGRVTLDFLHQSGF